MCPDYDASPLAACLAWEGAAPEGFYKAEGFDVTVSGTVTAVGTGAPPIDCGNDLTLADHAPLGIVERLVEADAGWVNVLDGSGTGWMLAWNLPGARAPAVGSGVSVVVAWHYDSNGTGYGQVMLADADGALIGWLASEAALEALSPPRGLSTAFGESLCLEANSCWAVEVHRFEVAEGTTTATLEPGDSVDLPSLHVSVGEAHSYTIGLDCEYGPSSLLQLGASPR